MALAAHFGARRALYAAALLVESVVFGLIALAVRHYYRNLSHKTYRRWVHLGNAAAGGVFLAVALLYALPSRGQHRFPAAHTAALVAYTALVVVDKAVRPAMVAALSKTAACRHEDPNDLDTWDLRSTQTSDAADPLAPPVQKRAGMCSAAFARGVAETVMLGWHPFFVAATASSTGNVKRYVPLLCLNWVVAAAMGMRYVAMELDSAAYCVLVLIHSAIAPLGVVLAAVVGEVHRLAYNAACLLSSAMMLYIGAFEMPYQQFVAHGRWLVLKSFSVTLGTWVVVGITVILVSKGVY